MSLIGAALIDCLRSVERPGNFCTGCLREIVMPAIDVEDVGRVAFPLLRKQVERLVAIAEAAPYGRGEETLLDRGIRRTWQIDPSRVRIGGRHWEKTLADLIADAAGGLGVSDPVAADFYKLLVYDPGSFFVDHRDTEKISGMFATLVVVLPSAHSGGELVVHHLDRTVTFDLHPEEPSEIGFAAFYADCVHEVRPITSGYRVTLVYNLRLLSKRRSLPAPDYRSEKTRVADVLRSWADAGGEPDKLVLPLEHAYTPAQLSFDALKGVDAGVASVLVSAAEAADCDIHLALVSIEESCAAEPTGYYHRGRWCGYQEDEAFEAGEVYERSLTLSEWRRVDGSVPGFRCFRFAEEELCPPDAFEDLTPDEEYFQEATGNEGASFERTYCRAGLVLWPRTRRPIVLSQAGLGTALPYLEDLIERWNRSGAAIGSPLWLEADELAKSMLRVWPRQRLCTAGDTDLARTLDGLARLGNAGRVEAFLAELSAEGYYAASDNEAIVRAAALLPRTRAAELLTRIIERNASTDLNACGGLLRRYVTGPGPSAGDAAQLAESLIALLPRGLAEPVACHNPSRFAPVRPGFVVDLLATTSQIDAALASRAVEHLLAWPETYTPDTVLVPAAVTFTANAQSAASPAVARLRAAAVDHLRRRIAMPLEPPRDWVRTSALRCACADCRTLGAFLGNPEQRQWRLKAALGRRSHVEQSIRTAACDLDLTTEKRGSPHTLVATKNQASYDRRAVQRRQDLQHLAALGG